MCVKGSFLCTETSGSYEQGTGVHLYVWNGLGYRQRACRGHADTDVDRRWVVCTSSGMYRSGGMLWCKIGQKVVWERMCEWDAYSLPLAWGTMRVVYPLGWK